MINKPITITGLDIGSSKIAGVVARIDKRGDFSIVACATSDSVGVSKGMLVDLNASVDSMAKVLAKLSSKTSNRLGEIYVNINGEDVKGAKSTGMTAISLRGREIAKPDIYKSVDVASTIHLPFDREIIHRIVHSFSIDDQPWIKNPLGLYASRLACEAYVITANINHIQSIYKCVSNAGYDVKGIVFTGVANGSSLLDKDQKDSGAILVDMGNSITEISVFFGGVLDNFDVMGIGGSQIRGDFRSSPEFDEIIKRIMVRAQDLAKRSTKAPAIILTGGFALTDGIIEFMEEKLLVPVKMGVLKEVRGDISGLDGIRLATAVGVAKYAYEKKLDESVGVTKRLSAKVVELFNNYF